MNTFEQEIGKELQALSSGNDRFFFRLFDTKSFRQISEKIYSIKLPCDFIYIKSGNIYFLELKSSKSPASYSFHYIRPHQLESLLKAEQAGSFYTTIQHKLIKVQTVLSYFLISNRSKQRHFKCYAIRVNELNDVIKSSQKKSIKWTELEKISMEIPRMGQGWNLNKLFNQ